MNVQHGIFDNALFVLLLSIPLIEWKWTWPRYLKRLATGAPGVRARLLPHADCGEWIPAACLLGWWARKGAAVERAAAGGTTTPLQDRAFHAAAPVGRACVAGAAGRLSDSQRKAILARPERMERVRPKLAYAEPLLPHTAEERRLFWLVSLTAGECEEIFFRGFLIWYLMAWMGPLMAVLLSSALFGTGHIYMGWAQAPKTGLVGLILAFMALGSASLLPAMLLHAALDWNSGELGYRCDTGIRGWGSGISI